MSSPESSSKRPITRQSSRKAQTCSNNESEEKKKQPRKSKKSTSSAAVKPTKSKLFQHDHVKDNISQIPNDTNYTCKLCPDSSFQKKYTNKH